MTAIEKYIDYLISETKTDMNCPAWNIEKKRQNIKSDWNYIDGCMIKAVLEVYSITKDQKYLEFADEYIDLRIDKDGNIAGYDCKKYTLDDINEGKVLFTLYALTGKEKYRKAIDILYSQILRQPRTKEGLFWHKLIYPAQVWLDGLYMCHPFYMEYETKYNNRKNYNDIFDHFFKVHEILRDPATGLYYHGYDSSRLMNWADDETGLSKNFWLRALGWFAMALLDTLEACDKTGYEKEFKKLNDIYVDLMESVCRFQDESGMFWQLPAFPGREKNYLETSGSSIMAYSLLKGTRLGFLPERFRENGIRAFNGVSEKNLKVNGDVISLDNICLVAGLGGKENRDGSYDYYMSEPIVKDDAKGVGPFLLAYSEMMRLNK